ncbi:MAG TPA: hypothetical protein VG269_02185, partial [Tepidisphaeraceae bacterium]|nr:hypothetical protein [Tepidisphaeraceae bacterium]
MAIFEAGVELIDPDTRGAEIGVMASHAVLLEEGFHDLLEGGIKRFARVLGGFGAEVMSGEAHARKQ